MRRLILALVLLLVVPFSAEAANQVVTGSCTFECNSSTCSLGAGCTATPDGEAVGDTYEFSGAITVTGAATTAARKGIALTGSGGITVKSGGSLTASVPTLVQNLLIQVGTGGLTSNTGGTLNLQGGWLPTYSSTQTTLLATRPANPMVVPPRIEFPSASVMRIWFPRSDATGAKPTVSRANGATGDAYITAYLEAIQRYGDSDTSGTPSIDRDVLFEIYDPYPDKFVSGSPWARYRILQVECNQAVLGTCNRAAASWVDSAGSAVTASATTDLGFIDVSMRQFQGDYAGMDPSAQDSVTGSISADVNPGQRCIAIGTNYVLGSGLDLRPREMQWAGWWITLEKNSSNAPTRGNSYAIGKSMDTTSPMSNTTGDWVCVADINGVRDAHVAATAAENGFIIHRGVFPGDNWYAHVPVSVTRDSGATERTVDVNLNGTTTTDGVYYRAVKHVGFGTASDRPDADVTATNMTMFDCEAAGDVNGGECISAYNTESGNISTTLRLEMAGLSGAGGGDCNDTAGPCLSPGSDGDVHFTQFYNFAYVDNSRSSIRFSRDDNYYNPRTSGAGITMLPGVWKAWYVEGSDAIDGAFGTDTGNMFDGGIGGSPTAGQYSDTSLSIKGAVCANCTTDDGAPQFSVWNETPASNYGTRTSGSISESGCLGCVGGGSFNDVNTASFAANVSNYVSLMGSTARLTNSLFGGAVHTPPNVSGIFVGEVASLGGTPNQKFYLWPRSSDAVHMSSVYLRDVALLGTGPRSGYLPNGGSMRDVLTVNVDASRIMSSELVANTAVNSLSLRNVTFAETDDFNSTLAATRWGTGVNGLFMGGAPGTRSNSLYLTAFFTNDIARHAAMTVRNVLATNLNNNTASVSYQNVASTPTGVTFGGSMCWFNNNQADVEATTLLPDMVSDGATIIRDRGPDAIDTLRGIYSAPGYTAQYGCGVSRPVGVCQPTYFTRRYNLSPEQFCSAGWAAGGATGGRSRIRPTNVSPDATMLEP